MRYTDKKYYMDTRFVKILDLCCERSSGKGKMDNLILVDGDEGYGKTNFALGACYYVAHKLKRPFTMKNVFFDVKKLIDFAKNTKDQVILWDEAALQGLASDWATRTQRDLVKLLMVARKKRHFFMFCIPKFFKLNEYLVLDRSIGLVHVYAKHEKELGRFVYFNKKAKERLYHAWRKSRQRNYRKSYTMHGRFVIAEGKVIPEDEYDKEKDKAIASVGEKAEVFNRTQARLYRLQYNLYKMTQDKAMTQEQLAKYLKITRGSISEWGEYAKKYPQILINPLER